LQEYDYVKDRALKGREKDLFIITTDRMYERILIGEAAQKQVVDAELFSRKF
jgi:hypothetical protein